MKIENLTYKTATKTGNKVNLSLPGTFTMLPKTKWKAQTWTLEGNIDLQIYTPEIDKMAQYFFFPLRRSLLETKYSYSPVVVGNNVCVIYIFHLQLNTSQTKLILFSVPWAF